MAPQQADFKIKNVTCNKATASQKIEEFVKEFCPVHGWDQSDSYELVRSKNTRYLEVEMK